MSKNGKRIVIAEDDSVWANVIRVRLEGAGFEVRVARDRCAALALLESEPFDLLVTDLRMPEMSGLELCQAVRARPALADLPILVLTATSDPADRTATLAALGVREIFSKPFTRVQLLQAIDRCLVQTAAG